MLRARKGRAMRRRQGQLFRKYALVLVALVGVTVLASNLVQLYFSYQQTQDDLLRIERAEAARAALRISQFVDDVRSQLIAALPPQGLGDVPLEQRRADLLSLQRRAEEIEEATFIDATGHEQLRVSRVSLNQIGENIDRSQDPAYLRTRAGDTYYGPVDFRGGSEPHFNVAVPESSNGPVILANTNLRFALEPVTSIKVGQAGHAFVVDTTGRLIAHPDISAVLRLTDLSSLPQVQAALNSTATADERAMVAHDLAGKPVLTAYEVIPSTRWVVFVEQPLDEAFAPLNASLLRAAGLLVAALVVAVAASLVLARRMTGPIEAIRAGAAAIGAGELGRRIDLRTGDELEELAGEFDRMSERLQESYATLEQKVDARTRQLAEAHDALARASKNKSDFLANMSHELRTPLNAVIGFSEVLLEKMFGDVNERQAEYLRDISTSGKHLLALVNDILDLSKVEAGKMELQPSVFSVAETVESGTMIIRERATRRRIALTTDVDPDLPLVSADERKVKQVLFNLLSNAVKFTPEGGAIDVRARRLDGEIHVSVQDTGPGIAPEDQARIFEEFLQTRTGATTEGSTGLGLTLAKRFMELHGGRLWVVSELGKGSTFTFALPVTPAGEGGSRLSAAGR
jgi:two-component system, NtrC family, sensor kinase